MDVGDASSQQAAAGAEENVEKDDPLGALLATKMIGAGRGRFRCAPTNNSGVNELCDADRRPPSFSGTQSTLVNRRLGRKHRTMDDQQQATVVGLKRALAAEEECERLLQESRILSARAESEKKRRIYYQNIVYAVCTELDKMIPGTAVCGTLLKPSTDVELRMAAVRVLWQAMPVEAQQAALKLVGEVEQQKLKGAVSR
jgi:hypothetical protein